MILNVSGRTDIVAFYSEWFMKRYEEGFVDVRNPFYPKKVSRIFFKDVELIVFCTKNPIPILPYLDKINIPILFQVTLTPYRKDIEPNVLEKNKIIEGIKSVSESLGAENVSVRYDPILLNDTYTVDYHIRAFSKVCSLLQNYVKHIIISFVDSYKNVEKNAKFLRLQFIKTEDYQKIGASFSKIAKQYNMTVQTCFEKEDLTEYGFIKSSCVSKELAYQITGKKYKKWTARKCDCVEMVDIGAYNSCNHLCKYCYANYDEKKVHENIQKHDSNSTMLLGYLKEEDEIVIRKNK